MPDNPQRRSQLLVADDEAGIRQSLELVFRDNYEVTTADSGDAVLAKLAEFESDAVLLDIRMPGRDGLATLALIRSRHPEVVVVMLTAVSAIETVVEAMRLGADDYVTKPFDMHRIRLVLERALERRALKREVSRLRSELTDIFEAERIVGRSPAMQAVLETARQVADRPTTVLIHGESGTGKELVARAIHRSGSRATEPMVVVNCAAIPEPLLESQLFGHEKGAFTDAHERRAGQFVQAGQGTVFLDEIGEMPLAMQSKLLRVLQEREVLPVGGLRPIPVAARIIAATNCDLERAVQDGQFRSDLYYRINVVPIHLPPLRERRDDIPLLIESFLSNFDPKRELQVSADVIDTMTAYDWPGNVRELQNVIERLVALAPGHRVTMSDLPAQMLESGQAAALGSEVLCGRIGLPRAVAAFETSLIERALEHAAGEQTRAARALGITRRMIKYKMDKYRIGSRDDDPDD